MGDGTGSRTRVPRRRVSRVLRRSAEHLGSRDPGRDRIEDRARRTGGAARPRDPLPSRGYRCRMGREPAARRHCGSHLRLRRTTRGRSASLRRPCGPRRAGRSPEAERALGAR